MAVCRSASFRWQAIPSILIIGIFFLGISWLIYISFAVSPSSGEDSLGFSLENYLNFLLDGFYRDNLTRALGYSSFALLFEIVLGYILAYAMYRAGARLRGAILIILILQFFTAYIVRVYAVMLVLGRQGLINKTALGLGITDKYINFLFEPMAVVIGLVIVGLPFVVLPIYSRLQQIPENLELAAISLGSTSRRIFWEIIFPLSVPGLLTGILLGFMFNATSYLIPGILGGGRVDFVANLIYNTAMQEFNYNFAAAQAIVTLCVMGVIIFFLRRVIKLLGANSLE